MQNSMVHTPLAARVAFKPAGRSASTAAPRSARRALSVSAASTADLAKHFNKAGAVSVVDGNGGLPKVQSLQKFLYIPVTSPDV